MTAPSALGYRSLMLEPRLDTEELRRRLSAVVGPEFVSASDADRYAARDMWPRALLRRRAGRFEGLPDLVAWPADGAQAAAVVRIATQAGWPVVPFGAGSGVCGGALPERGGLVLDLKRLDRILELDSRDHLLQVECGAVGENLERELNRRGYTLGHFPSSIYCSTVGGWIAARSAGQCSSRYGKIEDMVRAVEYLDAAGERRSTAPLEPGLDGFSLLPLLVGSEGALCVLLSASLVVRPLPPARAFAAFRFADLAAGVTAMRSCLRAGLRPAVLRLYDEFDTLIAKTGPEADGEASSWLRDLLGRAAKPLGRLGEASLSVLLGRPALLNRMTTLLPGGCLLVAVCEGSQGETRETARALNAACVTAGGEELGEGPARHWWKNRYAVSYKQSPLFAAGAFVDTMEVATTWERVLPLYRAVRERLWRRCFVMAHFSHAYREGCSIYFTLAAAAGSDERAIEAYDRMWREAQEAVLAASATVSHHHGIGRLKAPFLARQLGTGGALHRALKRAFDPDGRMNPGTLFADGAR
ncbi:MAG: FAD-binding oxidoreductase [Myxococcales bacterium]|nr:FAD-binding oxidoreductase [Myxococcales bacterium]